MNTWFFLKLIILKIIIEIEVVGQKYIIIQTILQKNTYHQSYMQAFQAKNSTLELEVLWKTVKK